jgi:IS30 family transposase
MKTKFIQPTLLDQLGQPIKTITTPILEASLDLIIENQFQVTWSPEQITERLRQKGQGIVCFKTIYRWLYTGLVANGTLTVLRHKGKWQKPAETRGKFAVGRPISQRPKELRSRDTFGHWELDTVSRAVEKARGV